MGTMTKGFELDFAAIAAYCLSICVGFVIAYLVFGKNKSDSPKRSLNSSDKISDVSKSLRREEIEGDIVSEKDEKVLSPSKFKPFKVLKVTKISHDCRLIRFEIHPEKSLGLTIGRHITVRAEIDGSKVMRAYTPTSRIDQKGYFDLLVKCYEFGKMSSYMNSLKVGQSVEIRGPVGRFHYQINQYRTIGLVAAGTGITPCLQFVRTILSCPSYAEDKTKLILFYQNRTEEDILLSEELHDLARKHSDRLSIYYFLSNPNTSATSPKFGSASNEIRGYITQELANQLLNPQNCPFVCMCGPSGFNEFVKQVLKNAGHEENSIFVW